MAPSAISSDSVATPPGKPTRIEDRLFINGEFVPSISGKKFNVFNPTTEQVSASVYEADAEDVEEAVKAAKAAYPSWSELSASERGSYLSKLADAIEKALPEIGYLDAVSMGKPYIGDQFGAFAVQLLRYYAEKGLDIQGDSSLNTANFMNVAVRQPFGVCGAIIPWNTPLIILIAKMGPALVAGNTLVLKSSEKSPLSPLVVARLCQEIGLPRGVLNILSGFGRPCGEAIARHMEIRKISFTGSLATGKAVQKAAAESNLKNVTLELGGKSPLVIFEDADLSKAIPLAAFSILGNSGQACIASSRVYVHQSIRHEFIEGMKGAMAAMGVAGDPTTEGTKRGPQADKLQFDRVMGFINHAKENKLDIPLGGNRIGSQGYFVEPTIIVDVPEESRVMKEEIFGPVVCINTFTDEEEVLKQANDTEFGLYASVFTRDIQRALRIAKKFEAGSVGVNCTSPMAALDMPFGGWKQSGLGRELGKYALEAWTELKSIFIAL